MKCPVCQRDLAPTLSICLACGAMRNDTVREELETKITPISVSGKLSNGPMASYPLAPPPITSRPVTDTVTTLAKPPLRVNADPQAVSPRAHPRYETADISPRKTSPTLVGFQNKNATLPDWRLQLQNSVRQRTKAVSQNNDEGAKWTEYTRSGRPSTDGSSALKLEYPDESTSAEITNPRVANALRRIEESRKAFLVANGARPASAPKTSKAPPRPRPFNVVPSNRPSQPKRNPAEAPASAKPKLVSSLRIEKKKYDTNKLPPLPVPIQVSSSLGESVAGPAVEVKASTTQSIPSHASQSLPTLQPKVTKGEPEVVATENIEEFDVFDDLAPVSMRFNAGLFDLIISVSASLILLSPFIFTAGTWLSLSGIITVCGATALVTFLYLTTSIAFFGRTLGMRIFSLELVDLENNSYATLQQAAVNSAVYILSLASVGLGFIPMFTNEERRAVHDLISGTILVKEL